MPQTKIKRKKKRKRRKTRKGVETAAGRD